MEKKEFAIFASALKTYYPREQLLPNTQAMDLWYRELHDIPFPVAEAALRKWVSTQKWSPSIADIRAMSSEIAHGEQLTWGESWRRFKAAVRKYGFAREREALESLDPLTRKCTEIFGYKEFCIADVRNEMADRAHYQRIFETLAQREKVNQQLALPLQEAIAQIQFKGFDGQPLLSAGENERK